AMSYYGLSETLGGLTNSVVLDIINDISGKNFTTPVPWCAAFVGSVLKSCGMEHTGKLNARSYLKYGKSVSKPCQGDIVVFWRGSIDGWRGHIGFFIAETKNVIYILGGNQNNEVCIKP